MPRQLTFGFILITVAIDSMGIGLVMPVMPDLIRGLRGSGLSEAAVWGGALASSYAVMQFLFGPCLGSLSDRFGRRPVLLVSLVVMGFDYLVMGFTGSIWILLAARIVGGITAATHATALAYMADVSKPREKAQNFGLVGAAFGVGFVLGPLLGGLLSELGPRAPFFAAAALAFANAAFGLLILPESLARENHRAFSWARANPFGALRHVGSIPGTGPLLLVFFLHNIAFFVYPSIWSYFTQERFLWDAFMVGMSLAAVGIAMAAVQGGLIRVIVPRLGEQRTVYAGLGLSCLAFAAYAIAWEGWMVFVLIPLTSTGLVAGPVLQGILSRATSDDSQGELQGVLAAVAAVATILSPPAMTLTFGYFTRGTADVYLPGAPFVLALLIELAALVVFLSGYVRRQRNA